MVVTNGVERAIQYFHAINAYLRERKSPFRAIVAFSGDHEYGGAKVSEATLNGFPSGAIAERIQFDPHRLLVCADKFQTGYDEPLLHTMYVDKTLAGIKAVQTLSRLNRAHPKKHDVFVLDFLNDARTIEESFADFYRATILADETDPNKLHDLQAELDSAEVYAPQQVENFVKWYLANVERDQLDPVLDACVARYCSELDEDAQVAFKGTAKAFVRTYAFLSSILPYTRTAWEQRSIFLNFLIPKLPAPREEDLSKGSSTPSTWTTIAWRSRRYAASCSLTKTPKSNRCRRREAVLEQSQNSTASLTSSRPSTTSSAPSSGTTQAAYANSSPRPSPRVSRRTPPTPTRGRTQTRTTRAWSTTRRCSA